MSSDLDTEPSTADPSPPGLSARAQRSRERLLAAATELLVESGPRAVTVDAVAESSGVAKSTLYRHWPSRDELLVDVVRCNFPAPPQVDLSQGFAPALRAFMTAVAETLGDPEWARIIPAMMSLRTSMPALAEIIDADKSRTVAALTDILRTGVDEGTLPTDLDFADVEPTLIGPLVLAAISGDHDRVGDLAGYVADRFIESYAR